MEFALQVQVLSGADQKAVLLSTMERFNAAAEFAAQVAHEAGVRSQPSTHKRCYAEIRQRFGLSAQMAVRVIGKVVETLASLKASGRKECPAFKPYGVLTSGERILRFKGRDRVGLGTLAGRIVLPLA